MTFERFVDRYVLPTIVIVAAIAGLTFIFMGMERRAERERQWPIQRDAQHCKHIGYTGRNTRIYQCDDGLRLQGEVK